MYPKWSLRHRAEAKGPVHEASFRWLILGAAFGWLAYVLTTSYPL
jgi:hypothetical protein